MSARDFAAENDHLSNSKLSELFQRVSSFLPSSVFPYPFVFFPSMTTDDFLRLNRHLPVVHAHALFSQLVEHFPWRRLPSPDLGGIARVEEDGPARTRRRYAELFDPDKLRYWRRLIRDADARRCRKRVRLQQGLQQGQGPSRRELRQTKITDFVTVSQRPQAGPLREDCDGNARRRFIRACGAARRRKWSKQLRIGSWNCRALGPLKKSLLAKDLNAMMVHICALQETWSRETQPTDGWLTAKRNFRLYDCGTEAQRGGVAFAVHKRILPHMIAFTRHHVRIGELVFRLDGRIWHVFSVYAPTAAASQENPRIRTDLYLALGRALRVIPNRHEVVVAGDFNAKLGAKKLADGTVDTLTALTTGRFGKGRRNENGTALNEFMLLHGLFASNTSFQNRAGRIATWQSPPRVGRFGCTRITYNQIDFILVRRVRKALLVNARAYPLTRMYSDHRLVITALRLFSTPITWC